MNLTKAKFTLVALTLCTTALVVTGCGGAASRQARYTQRGLTYLGEGKPEKARLEFRNALQIAPNDAQLRYLSGVAAEQLGDVRAAAAAFRAAIQQDPNQTPARAHLGELYLIAGLPDKALEQVSPGLAKHPDDPNLLIVHAGILARQNNMATALEEGRRAVDKAPDDEEILSMYAGLAMHAGQHAQVAKLLEGAVARNSKSNALRRVLVRVYLDEKNVPDAERVLSDLVRLNPGESLYALQLAQLYARQDQLAKAEATLRDAMARIPSDEELTRQYLEFLWARRGHEVAEAEAKRLAAASPADNSVHFAVARLYQDTGDVVKAEPEYQGIVERSGTSADALRARDALAAIYLARNDAVSARTQFAEVLRQNPGDNDALMLRAQDELAQNEALPAITDLRRVLRDQPNSVPVLYQLARAYEMDGEQPLAEESANRAVALRPNDPAVRFELARVLLTGGKFADGRKLLASLHEERPNDVSVIDLLYRASIMLDDTATARTAAEDLVRLTPRSGLGELDLGVLAESAGHDDEAFQHYQRALQLQPDAREGLRAMTLLLDKEKRYDEAVAMLDQAAARHPQVAMAPELKGEMLLSVPKRIPEAQEAFHVAMQRAPGWWPPYRGLAEAAIEQHDLNAAASVLRDAAAKGHLTDSDRVELAGLMTTADEPEDAIKQYEGILDHNPKSQPAAAGLAIVLVTFRTDSVSRNRAVSLVQPFADSEDWRLLDAFGWVHVKIQDFDEALPALRKAASTRPDAAQLQFHLGVAELNTGAEDSAEKSLSAAVASGTSFYGLDEAKSLLAQLRRDRSS